MPKRLLLLNIPLSYRYFIIRLRFHKHWDSSTCSGPLFKLDFLSCLSMFAPTPNIFAIFSQYVFLFSFYSFLLLLLLSPRPSKAKGLKDFLPSLLALTCTRPLIWVLYPHIFSLSKLLYFYPLTPLLGFKSLFTLKTS